LPPVRSFSRSKVALSSALPRKRPNSRSSISRRSFGFDPGPVIAVGVAEAVLPEDEIIGQIAPAVLNFDRLNHAIQDRTRTNIAFRPFPGAKQSERILAQTRLVAFPDGGEPFVKARERMTGLCRDEPLEARERLTKGARINSRHHGTGIPVEKPVQSAATVHLDTQRYRRPERQKRTVDVGVPVRRAVHQTDAIEVRRLGRLEPDARLVGLTVNGQHLAG
jgi:hypothetical protein